MLKYFKFFAPNTHCALVVAMSEKNKYHSVSQWKIYFPKHSRMGTTRMKYDKQTEEKVRKRCEYRKK